MQMNVPLKLLSMFELTKNNDDNNRLATELRGLEAVEMIFSQPKY